MLSLLIGILLGFGAAVPIGPVNVEIARRTLAGGFRAGFVLGCGAVTVDVVYAALTGFGLAHLLDREWLRLPLLIGGSAVLLYLGLACIHAAIGAWQRRGETAPPTTGSIARGYITGVLMTMLNPMTLAFWLVAVPAAGARSGETDLTLICAGVFLGTITWVIAFTGTVAALRRFRRGWWMAAADLAGGIILLSFAGLSSLAALRALDIIR